MKSAVLKIIAWLVILFCSNCFVAFVLVWLGSLIFDYTLHDYTIIIGGCVISVAEFLYVIITLNQNNGDGDWYD